MFVPSSNTWNCCDVQRAGVEVAEGRIGVVARPVVVAVGVGHVEQQVPGTKSKTTVRFAWAVPPLALIATTLSTVGRRR